ncbi:MAG: class I SAM-dependent rRNA methyltransferase [Pseudomonadota bacterium]|nr:class I SAM-dependent rRNA methyltransferase [Pseudomonadota bacterium]
MNSGRSIPGVYRAAGALTVNGYSEKWLRQGFPWVYPNEVTAGQARPGDVVRLVTAGGVVLGTALADDGWIAARRFRDDEGPLDAAFIRARVEAAWELRRGALPPDTTAWRLVNAENDDLPGIRIDVWGTQVVITLDAAALSPLLDPLADAVEAILSPRAILLAWRPDPREKERPTPPPRVLRGAPQAEERVTERGVAFLVRPGAGKDVGLFPDMRDNRAWLEPHWQGRTLLNLFAHTGAFSVSAAKQGAETVTVDLSQPYLDRAAANFAENGLPSGELLAEDSFKALDRFRRQGRRFDRVLLDPPGHSHSKDGTWSGEQDYGRLVSAALRVLPPGGWLIAASNLGSVTPHRFQGMLLAGARKAGRPLRMLHDGSQPLDFPAALQFPEGRFLKFVVCAA